MMQPTHLENAAELATIGRLSRHLEAQIEEVRRNRRLTRQAADKIKEAMLKAIDVTRAIEEAGAWEHQAK